MLYKYPFAIIFFITFTSLVSCKSVRSVQKKHTAGSATDASPYLEKLISSMTLEEKVGQLFIIRPESLDPYFSSFQVHNDPECASFTLNSSMEKTLERYPAGGICFFGKNIITPEQTQEFIKELQEAAKIPMFISVDEEGGRVTRVAGTKSFHIKNVHPMKNLGETGDENKAFETGIYISSYLKELGFNLNFAPIADINTNPQNIVIGDRAFSSNPHIASIMAGAVLDGFHKNKLMGCLKHFPGHGDTRGDTHTGYVAVTKTWKELKKEEIIPFAKNLKKTDMIMVAHITAVNVTSDGMPSTLSKELITDKLRGELGYDGVVITDSLAMKAITNDYSSAQAAVLTINAGADIILMPEDFESAFRGVLSAVRKGEITEQRLDQSLYRILKLKEKYLMN